MDCSSFDGLKLNFLDIGDGPITLIFIHGLGGAGEVWEEQIDYFSQKYRVVAIDIGGHGKSGTDRKHPPLRLEYTPKFVSPPRITSG